MCAAIDTPDGTCETAADIARLLHITDYVPEPWVTLTPDLLDDCLCWMDIPATLKKNNIPFITHDSSYFEVIYNTAGAP